MDIFNFSEIYETYTMKLVPHSRIKKHYRIAWSPGEPEVITEMPRKFNLISKETERRVSKIKSLEHNW